MLCAVHLKIARIKTLRHGGAVVLDGVHECLADVYQERIAEFVDFCLIYPIGTGAPEIRVVITEAVVPQGGKDILESLLPDSSNGPGSQCQLITLLLQIAGLLEDLGDL